MEATSQLGLLYSMMTGDATSAEEFVYTDICGVEFKGLDYQGGPWRGSALEMRECGCTWTFVLLIFLAF